MADGHIFSVSALTAAVRQNLERAFPFVWVRGQVTNLSRPSSGHLYFSLRDEESMLSAVWFKGNQKGEENFDPLTGEVYEDGPRPGLPASLENGQEILCAGRIAVYGARGVYQLVVELAQKAGLGRLHEEFARLRAKLEALGYFAPERKRPLPKHPCKVAVVTAPQGAAIHDFVTIAQSRGLGARVRVFPAPVQGEAAPARLMSALERIQAEGWAEVIVLLRGGGSIEDLWAFNNEHLARAVFESSLPVLAGIGHEVDFTLADMTADVRAATPSHAAQLLWPARDELARQVAALRNALLQAGERNFERIESRLRGVTRDLLWRSPRRLLEGWGQSLGSASRMLEQTALRGLESKERALDAVLLGLARAPARLPGYAAHLERLEGQLISAGKGMLENCARRLERDALRLEVCNPNAPLERGYALVRKEDGSFVKQTRDAAPGESLRLVLRDGEVPVLVREKGAETVRKKGDPR